MSDQDIEAKIDDLAQMVARGFTEMREEFKGGVTRLCGDIDIMLDRHIGTFRKDYDERAARVKRLDQLVLK
jgi:hypothetical protein